jgi:hypothetical protein
MEQSSKIAAASARAKANVKFNERCEALSKQIKDPEPQNWKLQQDGFNSFLRLLKFPELVQSVDGRDVTKYLKSLLDGTDPNEVRATMQQELKLPTVTTKSVDQKIANLKKKDPPVNLSFDQAKKQIEDENEAKKQKTIRSVFIEFQDFMNGTFSTDLADGLGSAAGAGSAVAPATVTGAKGATVPVAAPALAAAELATAAAVARGPKSSPAPGPSVESIMAAISKFFTSGSLESQNEAVLEVCKEVLNDSEYGKAKEIIREMVAETSASSASKATRDEPLGKEDEVQLTIFQSDTSRIPSLTTTMQDTLNEITRLSDSKRFNDTSASPEKQAATQLSNGKINEDIQVQCSQILDILVTSALILALSKKDQDIKVAVGNIYNYLRSPVTGLCKFSLTASHVQNLRIAKHMIAKSPVKGLSEENRNEILTTLTKLIEENPHTGGQRKRAARPRRRPELRW